MDLERCPDEQVCVPRKDTCIRANPWIEYIAARPPRTVATRGNMRTRGQHFRQLSQAGRPILQSPGVKRADASLLCRAFRARHRAPPVVRTSLRAFSFRGLHHLPLTTRQLVERITGAEFAAQRPNDISGIALTDGVNAEDLAPDCVWRFRKGGWLNDNAINMMVMLCKRQFITHRIVVMRPNYFERNTDSLSFFCTEAQWPLKARIRVFDKLLHKTYVWPRERGGPQWVLVPYNLDNIHWLLLAYNVAASTWHSLDSFNIDRSDICQDVHTSLHQAYPTLFAQRHEYEMCNVPQQQDGYQCGVWTIMYVLCFATCQRLSQAVYANASVYAQRYRKQVLAMLLTGPATQAKPVRHGRNK